MALPPAPINEPPGSFAWQQWYLELQKLYSTGGAIPWVTIDTSGSDIQDIANRAHNNLQSIQGGTSGSHYHLVKATKSSLVHDFGSLAAGAQSTQTTTVTGADTTDVVVLGFSSTPETGIEFRAWVSAADTVSLQAINRTAGAIDPASRTYYFLVMDN
jgi:hypothetical protein